MAAGTATVVGNKVGWTLATNGKLTDIDVVTTVLGGLGQRNPAGTIVQDDKGNEYVYLLGVAATAIGSWVMYDELFQTALLSTTTVVGPVAVALAAVLATSYGWYAIRHNFVFGLCVSDTFVDDSPVYSSATAGSVDDDTAAGQTVYAAWSRSAGTTTSLNFQIAHPFIQGQSGA